ncbi:MAG: alpha/beta hydrolase [Gammaproteobacteria bacterium]|nr:MAG: alpha/beta hydrolase [Gammaproteobacteria bacterium]
MYYFPSKKLKKNSEPIVFIHGTGMDHSVWTLPVRYFLRKKRDVLSIDLPGHGKSPGKLISSISGFSDQVFKLLDNNSIKKCSIVGHSMGSLITLEMASTQPHRVKSMSLIGTAFPMQVNDQLLEFAKSDVQKAIDILTFMGYSNQARIGRNKNPGMWMTESTRRLMQQSKKGVIYNDLLACSNFKGGLEKAKKVTAKVQLILGSNDFLTPTRKAVDLIDNFKNPDVKEIIDSGHTLMAEDPNKVLDYLIEIL